MSIKPKYLQHYLEKRCNRTLYSGSITRTAKTDIIVVIPSYKESLTLIQETLTSLSKAHHESLSIKVLVLVNYKEDDKKLVIEDSETLFRDLKDLTRDDENVFIYLEELKGKHKGVGMARKLLMDIAFLHFYSSGNNGIIVNLDADTLVEPNYYQSLYSHFKSNPSAEAASINFQHRGLRENSAILNYEFHLNYFIAMQRWVGLPFAYQTIGSAMAVRAYAYAKENGMNLRQAGEDFYFLHKYSKNETLIDIYDTTVYPSGRESDRVPFGTGKAVFDYNNIKEKRGHTYNPESFVILKDWLKRFLDALQTNAAYPEANHPILSSFLKSIDAKERFSNLLKSGREFEKKLKHFFNWFDAFKFFKYLHHCRDMGLQDVSNNEASQTLFKLMNWNWSKDLYSCLMIIKEKSIESGPYRHQWRAGLISNPSNTTAS